MSDTQDAPAWKQRAVERAVKTAKLRAGQRVERFLDAAQEIITEKGATDFTVQELVERSGQSLRSFYLQFDGKHELLLALFEDAVDRFTERARETVATSDDHLERIEIATRLLFEASRPDPESRRPLFTDFAPTLLVSHPAEVRGAYASLLDLFTGLLGDAAEAGRLHVGTSPRRVAAMMMQTIMFNAHSGVTATGTAASPPTADEVWDFCAAGFVAG